MAWFQSLSRYAPYLLALLRIVAGLMFMVHGLSKLFGFPEGAQPGQVPLLTIYGLAGIIELVGGLLIALGLFTRPAAFLASGQMAVAYWMAHGLKDIHPILNGGELAILYCFVFLYIAAAGPGAWALDRETPRASAV